MYGTNSDVHEARIKALTRDRLNFFVQKDFCVYQAVALS